MSKPSAAPVRHLISLQEAGRRLSLHPRTVRRMIADGKLTGFVVGRQAIRVDAAAVAALGEPVPTGGES